MRIASIMRNVILVWGIVLVGIVSLTAGEQKSKPPAKGKSATSSPALPQVWRSQASSHHEFRVRIEKDVFYAEWVNLPPDAAKVGAYIRTQCRRAGTKWIGTSRILLACAKPGETPGKSPHLCPMTLQFEVDSISPERISGRGETLKNFDCEKCEIRQTGWAGFVWLPKK